MYFNLWNLLKILCIGYSVYIIGEKFIKMEVVVGWFGLIGCYGGVCVFVGFD